MSDIEWRRVPIGPDASRWVTRVGCKVLLVIVHTVTTGQRLLDVVRLVESDPRIQVVFTMAPDVFGNGVRKFIEGLGALPVSWQQAVNTPFDLAVAASLGALHEIHAPLIVLPHGAGYTKLVSRRRDARAVGARATYGLDAQRLVHDGVVVPTAIVLPHRADLRELGQSCPEALPVAAVVGDPAHDKLAASLRHRYVYRRALRVQPGQRLVVVASTWGPKSLFARCGDLFSRLVCELPSDRFRVVALLHPNIWYAHGVRQVRAWLADALRRGLTLLPPEEDWQAALAAADWIIGDQGSATTYGAIIDVPVLLGCYAEDDVNPNSASAELAALAPRISPDEPLADQLTKAAKAFSPGRYRRVVERLTSEPGRFNRNMRRLMYKIMGLPQPATIPPDTPAAPPELRS